MTVRPRQTIHRGSVEAVGVIVAMLAGDEPAARRRVLAAWRPGATVFPIGADAWFVRWPSAQRLRSDRAPGLPVTVCGNLLVTAPLADDELAALAAPPGALVVVRHGACELVALAPPIDPADWLDVDGFARVDVATLGDPPRPAASAERDARPVRAIFAQLVGPAPAAARDVAAAMHAVGGRPRGLGGGLLAALLAASGRRAGERAPGRAVQRLAAAGPPAATGSSRVLTGVGALAVLAAIFAAPVAAVSALGVLATLPIIFLAAAAARGVLGKLPPREGAAPPARPASPPPAPARPPEPSRLRQALQRMLARTGLMRALGRNHSRYLQRVVDMFERGDYGEALRHAIPLGGESEGPPAPPALAPLSARKDLQIRPGVVPAASSLLFGEDDFSFLRQLYRKAFERLVEQQRIDEAAFLLAELLHADEEAVAFLERHKRHRLAAEIAEARGLAPGLVVRQWFLAGDRERAVHVARRKGAFADAVARLERDPERSADAAALRVTWAELLAAAGDYEVAVDIATPVPEASSQVRGWMDHAIDRGGSPGARMLARKLQRFPDGFGEHRDALVRLTDPGDPELAEARAHFLDVLVAGPTSDVVRTASRPLIRALFADAARGERSIDEPRVRKLALALGDDALRVDLPRWPTVPPREPLHQRATLLVHEFGPGDAGAIAVHDVAVLPDGKLLVALGELGVRLYHPDGRVVWHADQPAASLVLSDHGDRAIAVVARGPDVVRLARLDLVRRRASDWCEARLARWAADYDGQTWLVAETSPLRPDRSRLVVVDTLVDVELRALDHRDLELGSIVELARTRTSCVAVVRRPAPNEPERWRWDLPDWTLRRREPMSGPNARSVVIGPAFTAGAELAELARAEAPNGEHVSCHVPAASAARPVLHGDIDESVARASAASAGVAPAPLSVLHFSREGQRDGTVRALPARALRLVAGAAWTAVVLRFETCLEVHLMTLADLQVRAVIKLDGSQAAALRIAGDALAIADDRGRVVVVDLRDGALSRSLRVL